MEVGQSDWAKYCQVLERSNSRDNGNILPNNVTELHRMVTKSILEAAEESVTKTSGKRLYKYNTPWWDGEISKYVALRQKAKGQLWRPPTLENLIWYKKCEAKAKNLMLKKKCSWEEFTTSLNARTTTQRAWNKIRNIEGKSTANNYPLENLRADDNLEKTEIFLNTFSPRDQELYTMYAEKRRPMRVFQKRKSMIQMRFTGMSWTEQKQN